MTVRHHTLTHAIPLSSPLLSDELDAKANVGAKPNSAVAAAAGPPNGLQSTLSACCGTTLATCPASLRPFSPPFFISQLRSLHHCIGAQTELAKEARYSKKIGIRNASAVVCVPWQPGGRAHHLLG